MIAYNKITKDRYLPTGPELTQSAQFYDISGEKMKLLWISQQRVSHTMQKRFRQDTDAKNQPKSTNWKTTNILMQLWAKEKQK